MIITEAKRIVDNRIDVLCYRQTQNEYGSEGKYWIYSDQCDSKEEALNHIEEWVKQIQEYAEMLKTKIKDLEK